MLFKYLREIPPAPTPTPAAAAVQDEVPKIVDQVSAH